jgi:hypothetical protein
MASFIFAIKFKLHHYLNVQSRGGPGFPRDFLGVPVLRENNEVWNRRSGAPLWAPLAPSMEAKRLKTMSKHHMGGVTMEPSFISLNLLALVKSTISPKNALKHHKTALWNRFERIPPIWLERPASPILPRVLPPVVSPLVSGSDHNVRSERTRNTR